MTTTIGFRPLLSGEAPGDPELGGWRPLPVEVPAAIEPQAGSMASLSVREAVNLVARRLRNLSLRRAVGAVALRLRMEGNAPM